MCNNLAWTYNGKREYDEAIAVATGARPRPKHVNAHYNMGLAYSGKKEFDAAIAWYKKVIALDPNHVDAHFSLGWASNKKKAYDAAIEWYRKVIALDPKHAVRAPRYRVRFSKGGFARAIEWYEKAIALDPKYARAYYNIGLAYKRRRITTIDPLVPKDSSPSPPSM